MYEIQRIFLSFSNISLKFQTLLLVFEIQVCKIKTLSFET